MQNFSREQVEGAHWVLAEALEVREGDSVLVICDEATQATATCFSIAGMSIKANVDIHLVPSSEQEAFAGNKAKKLSRQLRSRIDNSSRVIFLQSPTSRGQAFRLDVLGYCQNSHGRRAASMPGVTTDYLHLCQGNIEEITSRCILVADLLVRAKNASLVTEAIDGRELELKFQLGKYKPIKSTGKISGGSWGNVPSGETFIVPNPRSAEGSISIRGSILNYPIPEGEELVLNFQEGDLNGLPQIRGSMNTRVAEILVDQEGHEAFPNCTVLGELGIGTNGDISEFTGLSLFDEKILGTVHIGLGRSSQFGGNIECQVHNDFVASHPRLSLDSIPVTEGGRFVLRPEDVYPNWKSLHPAKDGFYEIGDASYQCENSGKLQAFLKWRSPRSQRQNLTPVGDEETSSVAGTILNVLENSSPLQLSRIAELCAKTCEPQAVVRTISLLTMFGITKSND